MKPGTLTFKDTSVRALDLTPALVEALGVVTRVFESHNLPVIVTSLNDGKHRTGSFHYRGMAADLRSKHVPEARKDTILANLRGRLGPDFDVILEARGTENEHYHLEHDVRP